jgi:hypothetical protein
MHPGMSSSTTISFILDKRRHNPFHALHAPKRLPFECLRNDHTHPTFAAQDNSSLLAHELALFTIKIDKVMGILNIPELTQQQIDEISRQPILDYRQHPWTCNNLLFYSYHSYHLCIGRSLAVHLSLGESPEL